MRLSILDAEAVRKRSRGRISKNPLAADLRRDRSKVAAEKGGFFCEQLFGPFDRLDPLAFAHIELPAPLVHPVLPGQLECLPVLPAALRAPRRLPDGRMIESDLGALYNVVYGHVCRWARLRELNAPPVIDEQEQATVQALVESLFDNAFCATPRLTPEGRHLSSLAELLGDAAQVEPALLAMGLALG